MGGRGAKSGGRGGTLSGSGVPSADEIDALEYYVSGDGMMINDFLRGRNGLDESQMTDQDRELLKDLDAITSRDDVGGQTLYRSVDASAVFGDMSATEYENLVAHVVYGDEQGLVVRDAQRLIDRTQGKTYTDDGFMSTTKDREVAEQWGGFSGSDMPIVMEINTGKGVKGADVNKHANDRMKEVERLDPQKEVLLSRGRKVTVKDITARNGQLVVKVDVN